MNLVELTELLKTLSVLSGSDAEQKISCGGTLTKGLINEYVIIRTYAAGVFAGYLREKEGKEVILSEARRLWHWKVNGDGISLSSCAIHGIDEEQSKVEPPLERIWLEAIEIIPCTPEAKKSIQEVPNVKAY